MELTFITRETLHPSFQVPRIFLSSQVEITITLFVLRFLLLFSDHYTFLGRITPNPRLTPSNPPN